YARFETTQLSPIELHFRLPVEYPYKEAIFDVHSIWLPDRMRTAILKRLGKVAQENLGFPVLFLCSEDVKKFVEEEDMTEVFLGRSSYARKHNLRPTEVLELAREECERAELREFEAHCYDCNVCFENKTGSACVRFLPCGHTFCKECVSGYLNERLNSQEVSAIKCLCSKCESPIHQKLIIELAGQEAFDLYERILLSRALYSMGDVATCPRVVCQKPAAVSKV
ncbi:zinc finger, C3HC4 type, partial [Oesophagostomum dentatum]